VGNRDDPESADSGSSVGRATAGARFVRTHGATGCHSAAVAEIRNGHESGSRGQIVRRQGGAHLFKEITGTSLENC